MKRFNVVLGLSIGLFIILSISIFANPVFSQEPQVSIFTEVQLKPGMSYEFEKFMKDEFLPAMKEGGMQEMNAWKVSVFGSGDTYSFSSPVKNFAEFDNPHPIVKGVGPYGAQAMFAKMKQLATNTRSFIMINLPNLAIAPPEGYIPKLGLQIKTTIAPGRDEEYLKNTEAFLGILKKTNAKGFYAGRVGVGGNPNQYYFLVLFDVFSDMDTFMAEFQKAASETEMPSPTGIITCTELAVYRNATELAILPAAQ